MCRWMAYSGPPIFLDTVLFEADNSLVNQSLNARWSDVVTNGDGFGIGWYGMRPEPGLYREVLPAWNDLNLRGLAQQIQSSLFFAHVRASTGTETTRLNCHPFAFDRWLFMHNGQIGGYHLCRRELESTLHDDLFKLRRGSTDSELFFLLMIQNGLAEDPLRAIRSTIRQITDLAQAKGAVEPLVLTICLSDGQTIYTCRHATSGIPPSLYWQRNGAKSWSPRNRWMAILPPGRRSPPTAFS